MSATSIETILSRAMSDPAFAELLFNNPDQALAGYDLTPEEAASFSDLVRADLGKMAQTSPEERKSFGWSNHNEIALRVAS